MVALASPGADSPLPVQPYVDIHRPKVNPLAASAWWFHPSPTFMQALRMGVEGLFNWSSHFILIIDTYAFLVLRPTSLGEKVLKVVIYAASFFISPYLLGALITLATLSRWAYRDLPVVVSTPNDLAIFCFLEEPPAFSTWVRLLSNLSSDVTVVRNLWHWGDDRNLRALKRLIELNQKDPNHELPALRNTQFPETALRLFCEQPIFWKEITQMEPQSREDALHQFDSAYEARNLTAIRALLKPRATSTTDFKVMRLLLQSLFGDTNNSILFFYTLANAMKEEGGELSRWTTEEKRHFYQQLLIFTIEEEKSLPLSCRLFNTFLTGEGENDALITECLRELVHYHGRNVVCEFPSLKNLERFTALQDPARQAILEGARLRLAETCTLTSPYLPIILKTNRVTQEILLADPEISALLSRQGNIRWKITRR